MGGVVGCCFVNAGTWWNGVSIIRSNVSILGQVVLCHCVGSNTRLICLSFLVSAVRLSHDMMMYDTVGFMGSKKDLENASPKFLHSWCGHHQPSEE